MAEPLDMQAIERESWAWRATSTLRWRVVNGAAPVLEQMYERMTGERSWRPVQTILEKT